MKKEEFLAMSLIYGLIISQNGYQYQLTSQVYKLNNRGIWNVKPICRPLSDLTKQIDHKGEKFIPNDMLLEYYGDRISKNLPIQLNSFNLVMQLISWHFDIAGLIEKGEAIDINTLTENPYK